MNRRDFLGAAGAYAAIAGGTAKAQEAVATTPPRVRIDLNGAWDQSIGGNFVRVVQVPSSNHLMGTYDLSRELALPKLAPGEHAFLHLEAIAYFARVFCNGTELGSMMPYTPHEFDISGVVKERSNIIRVTISDLNPEPGGAGTPEIALGVNPGWEAYGGIIRDVWVELRPAAFIENARLSYKLEPDRSAAHCTLRLYLQSRGAVAGKAEVTLQRAGRAVGGGVQDFSVGQGPGEMEFGFEIKDPALWSPETPDLYEATVSIRTPGGNDQFSFRTGFREFRTNGTRFELNGQPIILNGVCRHDMWKDQGFTLTRQQMRTDMLAIKAMGGNFVRLVHYPHHRHVIDLSDELGLLVSEEPGYWQVNFAKLPRPSIELGLKILEKTIRRDWNSPSVVVWLLSNESRVTVEYLTEGKAFCRKLDPLGRLISAANDKKKEDMKPIFEQAGMDFFDQHPYTFDVGEFADIANFYGDSRPLTLTEWGGKEIGQSRWVMPKSVDAFLELQAASKLAGTMFWSWQDMRQYCRIDPEMRHGLLESGVVSEAREPREGIVMELRRLWAGRKTPLPEYAGRLEKIPLRHAPWTPDSAVRGIDLSKLAEGVEQKEAWLDLERILAEYWPKAAYAGDQWKRSGGRFRLWRETPIEILGRTFLVPSAEGHARPIVLTEAHPAITIPVGRACSRLHILGHVTCPDGYPPAGKSGAVAATLLVKYEDHSEQSIPLRHGYEIARGNTIYQTTRIDPIATNAQRALRFVKDTAREDYQVLLFSAPVREAAVESIVYRLAAGEQPLLVFAVSTEDPVKA
jgi:hypothetical protein